VPGQVVFRLVARAKIGRWKGGSSPQPVAPSDIRLTNTTVPVSLSDSLENRIVLVGLVAGLAVLAKGRETAHALVEPLASASGLATPSHGPAINPSGETEMSAVTFPTVAPFRKLVVVLEAQTCPRRRTHRFGRQWPW
jgi:hypothetical protein